MDAAASDDDDHSGSAEGDTLIVARKVEKDAGAHHHDGGSTPTAEQGSLCSCRRFLLLPFFLAVGVAAFFVISLTNDERWLRGSAITSRVDTVMVPSSGPGRYVDADQSATTTASAAAAAAATTTTTATLPSSVSTSSWSFAPDSCTILVVSDALHRSKNVLQAASLRSYATRHGYKFEVIDPMEVAPECKRSLSDFFFQKHCTVASWMERTQSEGAAALVLDGDVVAVGADGLSLDRWLRGGFSDGTNRSFDVMLYERSWNLEIAAGNYLVRNTPFARAFLRRWAAMEYMRPPGYSSSDNGAIHLLLAEVTATTPAQKAVARQCARQYRWLSSSVSELYPYFAFVACTRSATGPSRRFVLSPDGTTEQTQTQTQTQATATERNVTVTVDNALSLPRFGLGDLSGVITVLNRWHGFAIDCYTIGKTKCAGNLNWPFAHGEKDETTVNDTYKFMFRVLGDGEGEGEGQSSSGEWRTDAAVWKLCAGFEEGREAARCHVSYNTSALEAKEMAEKVRDSEEFWGQKQFPLFGTPFSFQKRPADCTQIPRMDLTPCVGDLSCDPFETGAAPGPELFLAAEDRERGSRGWRKEEVRAAAKAELRRQGMQFRCSGGKGTGKPWGAPCWEDGAVKQTTK